MDWTKDWQAKLKLNGLSPAQIEQVRIEIVEKLIEDIPLIQRNINGQSVLDFDATDAIKQQLRDKWL